MERYELTKGAVPITAAADLLANLFVGFDGNPCAASAKALGVPIFDVAQGDVAPLYTKGNIVPVIAGDVVAVGDPVGCDAAHKAVPVAALAAAAPVVDATKLSIDAGAVQVTSTAANGAVISAAAGFLAAPVLSGGAPPVAICGYALDAAAQAGDLIRVLLD